MLENYLQKNNVIIIESVDSWEKSVYLATENLLEQGYITTEYPKAIIELANKYGPYFVIAPEVALLHARPESGVIENQIAITLLQKAVYFDEKKKRPVKLLITLAAKNSKDHLTALKRISEILMDESKMDRILSIEKADELFAEFI